MMEEVLSTTAVRLNSPRRQAEYYGYYSNDLRDERESVMSGWLVGT